MILFFSSRVPPAVTVLSMLPSRVDFLVLPCTGLYDNETISYTTKGSRYIVCDRQTCTLHWNGKYSLDHSKFLSLYSCLYVIFPTHHTDINTLFTW